MTFVLIVKNQISVVGCYRAVAGATNIRLSTISYEKRKRFSVGAKSV